MENTNDINNPVQSQVELEIKKKMTQSQKMVKNDIITKSNQILSFKK